MRIDVVTIFPEYLEPLRHALLGKAIEQGLISVGVHDLRQWASGAHRTVDDSPCGGGPGMVMLPTVWGPALDDVAEGNLEASLSSAQPHADKPRHDDLQPSSFSGYTHGESTYSDGTDHRPLLVVPTPTGTPFTQETAQRWSRERHVVFACGRYEGIDSRVITDAAKRYKVEEVSIGDYVLIGGEVATLVMAEAVVRLIPGVLGNASSHLEDSFSDGLLEGPSYTKPRHWRGQSVPDILFSGDHNAIARWHRDQSLALTAARRPDLLDAARQRGDLSERDEQALDLRDVITEIQILIDPKQLKGLTKDLPTRLAKDNIFFATVTTEEISQACQADNMLIAAYEQQHGQPPATQRTIQLYIHARTTLGDAACTRAVANKLPEGTQWYGTTRHA
jgi:tRNA (guanine-1)-methyltransferase